MKHPPSHSKQNRHSSPSQAVPAPLLLRSVFFSILTGIFLFWLSETGIENRLFGLGHLFTFSLEGTFLPGKLIRLGICLLLCLLCGATPPGLKLRQRLNDARQKDWVLWLFSLLTTAVFFLWTLRITVLSFMTSDEVGILYSIVGVPKYGLAYAANTFSHVLFCGLIGAFYGLNPDGYWYTAYHLVALFASLVIIGRCIMLKMRRWPTLWSLLLHFLVCGGLFMFTFAQLSFTVTPAVVGSAAVALTLCRSDLKTTAGRIASDAGSILLMMLCILQRSATGNCLLCFWALACAYQFSRTMFPRQKDWKKQSVHLGCYVLCLAALLLISRAIANTGTYSYDSSFSNAEYYRSLIVDFLIDDLTTEHFESVGIPPELATLLRGWYFMDERINTETFKALAEAYYADNPSSVTEVLSPSITAYLSELFSAVSTDPQMLYRGLCLAALLLAALFSLLRFGRRYWQEFCCALCAFGGAFILCLYLIIQGRFPTRVYLVVILPALITALLMVLSIPEAAPTARKGRDCLSVPAAAAVTAFCVFCGISLYHVPYATTPATRETLFASQWAIEEHANSHPDICYVTNIYDSNLDPIHTAHYPTNTVLWGDGGDTAFTTGRLYGPDFFREDIQFMCQNPSYIMFLLQYLTLDNGPVQALDVAHLTDNIYVYDLSRVSPGSDYTGWYEQNGMTYYFENGQAVSGTKNIDGVEYEFAPGGSASFMTRVETEDGVIYTTKAYSLVTTQ